MESGHRVRISHARRTLRYGAPWNMQRYLLARPQRHDDPHPISKPTASYARATWPRPWLRNRGIQRDRKPYRTEHRYRRPTPLPLPIDTRRIWLWTKITSNEVAATVSAETDQFSGISPWSDYSLFAISWVCRLNRYGLTSTFYGLIRFFVSFNVCMGINGRFDGEGEKLLRV